MLASKQIAFGKGGGGGWENPYITDGLLFMWDIEWNAGGGIHSDDTLEIVDLSGNGITMHSNGSPVYYDKYIQPTSRAEMFYTDITDKMDSVIADGRFTMETIGECVAGKSLPNICIFGGGSVSQNGIFATFSCTDPTRIGFNARMGSTTAMNYGTYPPFARVGLVADGETLKGYYSSGNKSFSRETTLTLPVAIFHSKRFAIGHRYSYSPDSPMINGEKFYHCRGYSRPLSDEEIAHNYAVDQERFGL